MTTTRSTHKALTQLLNNPIDSAYTKRLATPNKKRSLHETDNPHSPKRVKETPQAVTPERFIPLRPTPQDQQVRETQWMMPLITPTGAYIDNITQNLIGSTSDELAKARILLTTKQQEIKQQRCEPAIPQSPPTDKLT